MRLNFVPTHVFRETPQVSFFDAGVKGSNGSDVVIHHGNAISPPNDGDFKQYYVHRHQIDHNLVCLLYTSPSPRDATLSRMPSSA